MATQNIPPLLTDDTPPAYIIQRVVDSDAEAARAQREIRELDAIQRKRGQSKPRRIAYRNQTTE